MPSYLFPSRETEAVARRLARGEIGISFEVARRVTPSVPLPAPYDGTWTEADRHGHAARTRNAETKPPRFMEYTLGALAVDLDGDHYELREIRLDDPRLAEVESPGRFVSGKYAEWILAGHRPPPIRLMESEKGTYTVHDGHHRLAALRLAGAPTVRAWVCLTINRVLDAAARPVIVMGEALTRERAIAAFA